MARELVLIGIGSNVDPERNIAAAAVMLRRRFSDVRFSSVYASAPVGPPGQPRFLNAAAMFRTDLPAQRLKQDVLRPMERALGRVRTHDRYAPRPIDLDIALYGRQVVSDMGSGLIIPDPDIEERAFLALPLAQLAPDLVVPGGKRSLREIAAGTRGASGVALTGLTIDPAAVPVPQGSASGERDAGPLDDCLVPRTDARRIIGTAVGRGETAIGSDGCARSGGRYAEAG